MEHPFLSSQSLGDKSLEELQSKITDLNNKLSFAYRTGNRPLINQLHMVLESYRNQSSKKMDEILEKQNIKSNVNIQKEEKIGNKNRP
jgi:hypothetical protein